MMFDSFIAYALFAGAGMALMCGPLGCFIAWMRLAYFGETIGHAAILGIVFGLVLGVNITLGILLIALLVSLLLAVLLALGKHASDTLLGVLAHGALASGLVLLSLTGLPVNLEAYLFGDILAVTRNDIVLIFSVASVVLVLLVGYWRELMLMIVNTDIARVEGVNVSALRLMLMVMIALVIAVSIKLIGILLVTSLLIIPAATARFFARSPHAMAVFAAVLGMIAVSGGVAGSYFADTPTGPSIIVAALAVFLLATSTTLLRKKR